MKVKCIRGAAYALSNQRLIEGNIYEATQSPYSADEYLINGASWFKGRFVVVSYVDDEAVAASVATIYTKKQYAPDEECPCGIKSSTCTYHKE
jgi:hypothetical protein